MVPIAADFAGELSVLPKMLCSFCLLAVSKCSLQLIVPQSAFMFLSWVFASSCLGYLQACCVQEMIFTFACTGYDWKSFRLLITYFGHRLIGTGGIWFCNDWYFYGNGVFRSTFVGLLVGSSVSVQVNWLYSYINTGVQLVGYYCAAMCVDYRWIGRRRLTVFSFIMVSLQIC